MRIASPLAITDDCAYNSCLLSIQPIGQMLKASDDVRFNCSKQELYAQSLVIAKCDAIRMVL